jgi:NTE family protein
MPIPPFKKKPGPKTLSLALQGGGAHGAFEWGILDRLLEEQDIEIRAVTAASAGAMNAVCLAAGKAPARGSTRSGAR